MSRGSVLPEGMALAGEIRGQGDLVVAGTIEGPVAIDGHLTVEATGVVRGEVKARAIVLRGTLTGPAVAEETIRLEPGARMVGDARAERVSVVEGVLEGELELDGSVAVGPDGTLVGPVRARGVEVAGEVHGDVLASDGVAIRAGGRVQGDVRARRIAIDDGAALHGGIEMDFDLDDEDGEERR